MEQRETTEDETRARARLVRFYQPQTEEQTKTKIKQQKQRYTHRIFSNKSNILIIYFLHETILSDTGAL